MTRLFRTIGGLLAALALAFAAAAPALADTV